MAQPDTPAPIITTSYMLYSSSFAQSNAYFTALFQPLILFLRSSSSIFGSKIRSIAQFFMTSSLLFQYPTASLPDKLLPCCSLDTAGPLYRRVHDVRLRLHQEVIGAGATVYAEGAEINARILLHGFQNVVYLIGRDSTVARTR